MPTARSRQSRKGTKQSTRARGRGRGGSSSSSMSSKSHVMTDHDQIRKWVESRGGRPACVKGTGGGGDVGMLRIDFPDYTGEESLRKISWDKWFDKFDKENLALLYQDTTDGTTPSRFNKIISRNDPRDATRRRSSSTRSSSKSSGTKRAGARRHGRGAA